MSREIGLTENYRTHKECYYGIYYVTFSSIESCTYGFVIVGNVVSFLLCFIFYFKWQGYGHVVTLSLYILVEW